MARKNKNEAKITFKAETKEFTQGIKDMNDNMKTLNKQLKLNQAEMKNNGETVEGLRKEQDLLNQKLQDSNKKIEETRKCLEKAKEIYGENSEEVKKWTNKLLDAEIQNQSIQSAINKTNDKLQEMERATQDASNGMDDLSDSTEDTRSALEKLEDSIKDQEDELKRLAKEYYNVALEQGKDSTEAQELKSKYNQLQGELDDTRGALKDLQGELKDTGNASDDLGGDLDDLGNSSENAGDGFTTLKGALAEFVGNIMTEALNKVKDLIAYIWDLVDATKEYRMLMAKFEGSTSMYAQSQKSNKVSQKQNTKNIQNNQNQQYKKTYGYLGDEMATVNSITNLQKLNTGIEQQEDLLNGAIAVWTAYGDSIPIEGLTESITETIQVGKVTGNLADALNWAGISEDDFNEKLEKCTSQREREILIANTLNRTYGESKKTYDENTKSLRAYNESQAELMKKEAELAEVLEPVQTKFNEVKVKALEAMLPVIQQVCDLLSKLFDWWNGLSTEAQQFIIICGLVVGAIIAIATVIAVIGTVITVAIGFIGKIKLAVSVFGTVMKFVFHQELFSIMSGATKVFSMSTSMWIVVILAVIVAVVTLVIEIYRNWDKIKATFQKFTTWLKTVFTTDWSKSFGVLGELMNAWLKNISNIWNAVKTVFNGIVNFVKGVFTGNWRQAWKGVVQIFAGIFGGISAVAKAPLNGVIALVNGAIGALNKISVSIPDWVPKFGGKSFGINIPKIPYLAKGGIVSQATTAVIGEAGSEAVVPLDGFYDYVGNMIRTVAIDYDKMQDCFASALSGLSISMDSREVGRLTSDTVNRTIKTNNRRLDRLGGNTILP